MDLCFATNNRHKIEEIRALLPAAYNLVSLKDIGCDKDLKEEGMTLEENAVQKARYIYNRYRIDCFADDTGLETEALNGEPGVRSARYAGEHKNDEDNIRLLLSNLGGNTNRRARFRTVIALVRNGEDRLFEGIVNGAIIGEKRGVAGFGYDPVFVPDGHTRTFAQMSMEEKGKISHRGRAVMKLIGFLHDGTYD